jgi:RNA-directed DNA polymerase
VVNGPEGDILDWLSIDWQQVEGDVRRLRQRIFTASQAGDLKKVRNLQKLMLRSHANTLVSVRRVTELNAGRKTAGVDGQVVVTAYGKAELADWMQRCAAPWKPKPVKRVYIPKANGKQRPLGVPVIVDRVLQARVVNALEPEWEARFEPKSYGFRPGRGCHDAIESIYKTVGGKAAHRLWVLDADLAAAFDRIDHAHLLAALGTFPARAMVEQWLKAGVVDKGRLAPTEEGTPQGGVVSPVLLNVALHGMEEAAGVRYRTAGVHAGKTVPGSPVVVRYADDLVAMCASREEAEEVKERLAVWLAPRGLVFNEDKTRVVHLGDGFDFLGFNVRRYRGKLLIKPSKAALRRIRERLAAEMKALRGANAKAVLQRLNPIIRGWSAYYRTGCPAGRSPRWTSSCGRSPTSGPSTATRTSRSAGLSTGTSAPSTGPGVTGGCLATVTAAPTCSSSPGPRSSGIRWCQARRLPTTRPWPSTGPSGDSAGHPRWTASACVC